MLSRRSSLTSSSKEWWSGAGADHTDEIVSVCNQGVDPEQWADAEAGPAKMNADADGSEVAKIGGVVILLGLKVENE